MKKTFVYTLIILGMLLIGCSAITGKIEHEYGDWTLIQNETCEEDGILERKCKICGKKENQSIPKLSHEFDDGKITVEPTCTEKGEKTFTCKNCDATKTEEIDECGHSFDDGKITVEPTCTEKGEKTFTCKNCDATKTEEIDECGHSYDDGLVIEVATCTSDGSKKFICVVCNESKKEVIPATGHSYDGIKCSKCGTSSVTLCTTGVEYIENDNLKLTLSSLTHSEINGYNKYTINYVLKNEEYGSEKTPGVFKIIYKNSNGVMNSDFQYGAFNSMYYGDTLSKSYTFTLTSDKTFVCIQYVASSQTISYIFSESPVSELLTWICE